MDHRLEHLRRGDDGLAELRGAPDRVLLHERHGRDTGLDAVVAAGDHDAVRRGDDLVEVFVGLDLLDLGDRPAAPAEVRRACAQLLDVGRRAHEGQRDEVGAELGGDAEIGDVLVGDRRKLGPRVGDVDPLARRELSA